MLAAGSFSASHPGIVKNPKNSILIFGDPSQKALCDQIAHGFNERVLNLAARTSLRELITFISEINILLTNHYGRCISRQASMSLWSPFLAHK